jgi:hypothetical protein
MATNLHGIPKVGDHFDTSFGDSRWMDMSTSRASVWFLGDDPCGPMIYLSENEPTPEHGVPSPVHYHDSDQLRVIMEGSLQIGRTWLRGGHVRCQTAGGNYGPEIEGPTGAKEMIFFADRRGAFPHYAKPEDREAFGWVITALSELFGEHVPEPGSPEATREYRPMLVNSLGLEPRAGHIDTSFDDPAWSEVDGMRYSLWCLSANPAGPAVVLVDAPPGTEDVPVRQHGTDQFRLVLAGSCRIGDTWYRTGDVRVQDAGEFFGPEVTGPEGCRQVIVFARRDACQPVYADAADAVRSSGAHTALSHALADLVELAG